LNDLSFQLPSSATAQALKSTGVTVGSVAGAAQPERTKPKVAAIATADEMREIFTSFPLITTMDFTAVRCLKTMTIYYPERTPQGSRERFYAVVTKAL
jgi:hypothetical protein